VGSIQQNNVCVRLLFGRNNPFRIGYIVLLHSSLDERQNGFFILSVDWYNTVPLVCTIWMRFRTFLLYARDRNENRTYKYIRNGLESTRLRYNIIIYAVIICADRVG